MIDVKMYCRCNSNPICDSATLFFDPEKEIGLYVVRQIGIGFNSCYKPIDLPTATLIYETLNDGEHEKIINDWFAEKNANGLYPIAKVNTFMWALKLGRLPLTTIERFNRNGYFKDGKIGG